ncbi:cytochrome c3 family protein [Consotaella aegiceratis]|uniref:cytochrome c3 family protein n=1 Tax=Consotaella aegiceratis TaxID=3097961 RepID=UPI002F40E7D9
MRSSLRIALHGLVMAFCAGLTLAVASAADVSKPVPKPDVKGTDCAGCHDEPMLPADHRDITQNKLIHCQVCHAKQEVKPIEGNLPLMHAHLLARETCVSCHDDPQNPKKVKASKCITCHDPAKVAKLTADVKPTNPHDPPHEGMSADCTECHHSHKKSQNYCKDCHDFDFVVP